MRVSHHLFRFLLAAAMWLCGAMTAHAGIGVYNGKGLLDASALHARWLADTSTDRSFTRFLQIKDRLRSDAPGNMSNSPAMFWVLVDIPAGNETQYALLNNPHLNYASAWVLSGDSLVHTYKPTGDHTDFYNRDLLHPEFVFPLPAQPGLRLLLLVEKRHEPLRVSVYFLTTNELMRKTLRDNLGIALLTGICLFALLFTLFLFVNVREAIYVYYAGCVVSYLLYLVCDSGYGFMYLFPHQAWMADFSRPFLITLVPIFYLAFSRDLLQLKLHFPKMYRYSTYVLMVYISWYVLVLFAVPKDGAIRSFLLDTMRVIILSAFLMILFYSAMSVWKRVRYSASMLAAGLIHVTCSQVYIAYNAGQLSEQFFFRSAAQFGLLTEMLLLTLVVSLRFRDYKKSAEALLMQIARQQEEVFRNISHYREQQMNHISGVLHNSIGASLSSVKYNLEAVQHHYDPQLLQQTLNELSQIAEEVRGIAHSISPVLLQQKGLIRSLEILAASYNRTGRIRILLENIGSLERTSFQNEILVYQVVQELIQNVIRHANATELLIQLILEPELVSIFAEDNGRGFNTEGLEKTGLGLAQIRQLTELVNGRFEIESTPGVGTSVSIEFPVHTQNISS